MAMYNKPTHTNCRICGKELVDSYFDWCSTDCLRESRNFAPVGLYVCKDYGEAWYGKTGEIPGPLTPKTLSQAVRQCNNPVEDTTEYIRSLNAREYHQAWFEMTGENLGPLPPQPFLTSVPQTPKETSTMATVRKYHWFDLFLTGFLTFTITSSLMFLLARWAYEHKADPVVEAHEPTLMRVEYLEYDRPNTYVKTATGQKVGVPYYLYGEKGEMVVIRRSWFGDRDVFTQQELDELVVWEKEQLAAKEVPPIKFTAEDRLIERFGVLHEQLERWHDRKDRIYGDPRRLEAHPPQVRVEHDALETFVNQ